MRSSLLLCGKQEAQEAQAFTLEGLIAALLMLIVAYFLFQSTLIISPLSSESIDVQLRQYGIDALTILKNPDANVDDALENALAKLNDSTKPVELLNSLDKILPENVEYRLEVWFLNRSINELQVYVIDSKEPTSDTVSVSTYLVLKNGELVSDSPFKLNVSAEGIEGVSDSDYPVVLEVKLVLWRI